MSSVRFRTLALMISLCAAHAGAQVVRPEARIESALTVLRKAKSFDDEAAALKHAEKLIASKRRKGYTETVSA